METHWKTGKEEGRKEIMANRAGRPKGATNKITRDVREAIAKLSEETAPKVAGWLASVAEEDPGRALDLWLRLIEYHIPKLARTEHTGTDGESIKQEMKWTIEVVSATPKAP